MVCYNLYIFNREGTCISYIEWFRPKSVKQGAGSVSGDFKQVLGLCWSLNELSRSLDPKDSNKVAGGAPRRFGEGCRFRSFTSSTFKMHYLEIPSGIKIMLNTSREIGDLSEVLQSLYDDIFVEYVVKSPQYTPGQPFHSDQFVNALNLFLRQHGLHQHVTMA